MWMMRMKTKPEIGQLRRWVGPPSSLEGKLFLIIDQHTGRLPINGSEFKLPIWVIFIDGRIEPRSEREIEKFSEVLDETR